MVAFYNQADQDIYKTDKFMPQSRFLLDAPKPVVEKEKVTESFGIPQTQAFNNSGGGVGGGYYPGPAGDLATGFQSTVNARQNRLNNPSNTFLGFNTMRDQQLTGADAGEYIGSGTNVPQEQTLMGKAQSFLNPQSAQGILEDGYQEPRFQPGIMATIMGKMDNYRNLSRTDQAFIAQNMGYTGPTVFGENNSGLGKDPFGINTRSALGNYGEFVDKKSGQLTDTLTKQGGKIFDKYAVNPITGQALDEEEFSYDPITGQYIGTNAAAIAKANKMNKMNLTQLGFYRGKKIEKQTIIDNKKAADLKAFEDQKARSGTTSGANDGRYENINDRNRGGQGAFQEDKTSMKSAGKSYQDAKGNVGYSRGRKDGGRIGYFFGGRVNYRDGGLASIL